MSKFNISRSMAYSFAIAAFMEGGAEVVLGAVPLLAIRFGANPWLLGMLGWVGLIVRLPFCLASGNLSDRIGRMPIIVSGASAVTLACIGLSLAVNNLQVILLCALLMAGTGAFYPAFQSFIGDRSPQGELRKNLSGFNTGWAVGGSVFAVIAGYLLAAGRSVPFLVGVLLAVGVILCVWQWYRSTNVSEVADQTSDESHSVNDPGALLLIARIGQFFGYAGLFAIRSVFPKLGVELGMNEGTIGMILGLVLAGAAVGIFVGNAGPWWRGKLWPLVASQLVMVAVGIAVFLTSSRLVLVLAFLCQGLSVGIIYTAAIYYGLQARANMGRSMGIHESLITGGGIAGSLMGGAAAQFISLRSPYIIYSGLVLAAAGVSMVYWHRSKRSQSQQGAIPL